MSWKLKRVRQCEKCPWKVSTDPHDIPNGYDEDWHRGLACTIAEPGSLRDTGRAMACHEHPTEEGVHCVGWLMNQLGAGNNIGLRLRVISCENIGAVRLDGPQHDTFEDTLPMSELRQREPRIEHPAYLAHVRTLPCTVSGKAPPSDAAHLRAAALHYGKPHTGMQQKPDDRWTLPLSREMHEAQHRYGDELAWWSSHGFTDPFALAVKLYESRPPMPPPLEPKPFAERPVKQRKPKSQRRAVPPSRPLQSSGRAIQSRPMRRAEPVGEH